MTVRGVPAPQLYQPSTYWEDRAQRFAGEGAGLAAVCAYGMPEFYNRTIHLEQRLALRRWLDVQPGTRVLDVGCGVGRWSRLLAAKGAQVTGVDLSPTMIAQAQRRAAAEGVAARCSFRVQDLSQLEIEGQFDLVLGVTVLQHILEPQLLRAAVRSMAARLAPGGRMILLEAAPAHIDVEEVGKAILECRGVAGLHDLHVWRISDRFDALTVHVTLAKGAHGVEVSRDVALRLRNQFGLEHVTVQPEAAPPGDLVSLRIRRDS